MANKLKSLEEHNGMRADVHYTLNSQTPIPNGIACPKCGKELFDTQPNVTLTSNPPQKNIGCLNDKCDYTGYRIA